MGLPVPGLPGGEVSGPSWVHTEWISKGKAGVPQELGLRVCVLQDQYGLVLHQQVMEKETDDKVAVYMVACAQKKFPSLRTCSFDKGFYSPANKKELNVILDFLVLPKKASEINWSRKRKHQNHGIIGFKRYVSLAVLARNLQIIGNHIQQKECKRLQRTQMDKAVG